jgi:hypothetical protein
MARTNKTGIDYFPFQVDFFEDDKIQLIESEFGMKGGYIAIRLLCKIYKEGYYYKWGADECLLFTKAIGVEGVSKSVVDEVISGLIRRRFFDKRCFDSFGILTSKGIQQRYFEAAKRYKEVIVVKEYLLIDNINSNNVSIISINADNNQQKRGKEKKEKGKEKENNSNSDELLSGTSTFHPEQLNYEKLVIWFNSETKGVFGEIQNPISENRKSMIRSRIREHGKQTFYNVIKRAYASDFLKGNNKRSWRATFDWIIKPTNYEKILSGNFDNKANGMSIDDNDFINNLLKANNQ